MLQSQSILKTADNSGAKFVYVIKPMYRRNSRFVFINGLCKVSVRYLKKSGNLSVKAGHIYLGLLVRTSFGFSRFNGNWVKFSRNSIILLDMKKNFLPYGTRIFGCVTRELRLLKYTRILMLAALVL